jgi:hypothetical protein
LLTPPGMRGKPAKLLAHSASLHGGLPTDIAPQLAKSSNLAEREERAAPHEASLRGAEKVPAFPKLAFIRITPSLAHSSICLFLPRYWSSQFLQNGCASSNSSILNFFTASASPRLCGSALNMGEEGMKEG